MIMCKWLSPQCEEKVTRILSWAHTVHANGRSLFSIHAGCALFEMHLWPRYSPAPFMEVPDERLRYCLRTARPVLRFAEMARVHGVCASFSTCPWQTILHESESCGGCLIPHLLLPPYSSSSRSIPPNSSRRCFFLASVLSSKTSAFSFSILAVDRSPSILTSRIPRKPRRPSRIPS